MNISLSTIESPEFNRQDIKNVTTRKSKISLNERYDKNTDIVDTNGNEKSPGTPKELKSDRDYRNIWPANTVLITGDSLLNEIDENRLSKKFNVKVRCQRGANIADMYDHIKPYLRKNRDTSYYTSPQMMQQMKTKHGMKY